MTAVGVRGIEHVGITVPDLDAATRFFRSAFGAVPLFDLVEPPEDEQAARAAAEAFGLERRLGVRRGTWTRAMRMLRLGNGANVELFEFVADGQRAPAVPSDLGIQHLAVAVDDLDATAEAVVAAGGTLLDGPCDLPAAEAGPGNRFWYTRAPWGTTIELVSIPSTQAYEHRISGRRWTPA